MKNKNSKQGSQMLLFTVLSGLSVLLLTSSAWALEAVAQEVSVQKVATGPSDYVSVNVDGGSLVQVLNAFAIQTGRNIVVGPNVVVKDGVTLHLNNVRWDEALDVILKPYGFGYQKVGETVVVGKLSEMAVQTAVEPLETRVFTLHYLDASDVQEVLKGQLSPRGSVSVAAARGQKGWQFAASSGSSRGSSSSGGNLGKMTRAGDPNSADQVKSKTLLVTDVPSSLARVAAVLAEVDKMPQQVQIEARFLEVNDGVLRDIGIDWSYKNGSTAVGQKFSTFVPGVFSSALHPGLDMAAPMSELGYAAYDNGIVSAYIRMLQEDKDTKLLSAPRILTLNNQEATIIVGQKYPIIKSDVNGSTGVGGGTTSTSLDYYENIGIQLNVVPQICADDLINMIVHPSVSSIIGFASGKTTGAISTNANSLTEYPIINMREAETQIMLKNSETIVIGGLLEERKADGQSKIPFLGDIPLIGRLFRRDTTDNRTMNLLIFLSATVIDKDNYSKIIAKEGSTEISDKPKDAEQKPVAITVPAAAAELPPVPPAAVAEAPAVQAPAAAIVVKAPAAVAAPVKPQSTAPASVDQIYKELQK